MIKKVFGDFICNSCGKETPVQFVVYGPQGFQINSIFRSNKFAEDFIDSLRKKNLTKQKKTIEQQAKTKRTLKNENYSNES